VLLVAYSADAPESAEAKIARALSAGPPDIAKSARIVDTDAQGMMVVLREGRNGFTCMPGNPRVIGESADVRGCRIDAVGRRPQGSQTETDQHGSGHHLHAGRCDATQRFGPV
jgi:hypothetical protein